MSSSSEQSPEIPRHVAIIMDGNGRWAQRRFMPRLEGHRQGAKAVRNAVEFCRKRGIEVLTLYAFSTENWERPSTEVSGLMKLLSQYLDSEIEELHSNGIRFSTIGDVTRLPNALQSKIASAKEKTGQNTSMILNIALSYGGRREIIKAAIKIAEHIKSNTLSPEDVTEEMFGGFLSTAGLPDPDLLIRTGGELRISNFLLWQSAYTELYFTDTLWPDFNEEKFQEAIGSYQERQRRFGKTSEQIKTGKRAR